MAAWRECSAPPHAAGALAPYTCKFVRTLPEVTVKLRHALLSLAIAACVSTPAFAQKAPPLGSAALFVARINAELKEM